MRIAGCRFFGRSHCATAAIVAAVAGAGLAAKTVVLMAFSNVLADAISMGLGDYLSSKAEMDFVLAERKREAW